MSGTSDNSTKKPKEEEISLDEIEPALSIEPGRIYHPEYYECDDDYRVFDQQDSD